MEHEMQKITFEKQMKFNAFKVYDELSSRIDSAPTLNGFMKSQTSLAKSELFFNNEEYLKTFIIATPAKKLLIPGYNYFSMLQNFINRHFEVGEKHLAFLQFPCVDTCEQCSKPTFTGPKCHKIPKPMPEY